MVDKENDQVVQKERKTKGYPTTLKNGNVVPNSVLLVLGDTLCDPCDVSHLLGYHISQSYIRERGKGRVVSEPVPVA